MLVTDPWLSPAAASARFVLVTGVQTTVAPFDSMVSAVALTEALIAGVLARLGERAHARMRRWTSCAEGSSTATGPEAGVQPSATGGAAARRGDRGDGSSSRTGAGR